VADRPAALVTGASSGVGIDFAQELARRGFNLVLTARRSDRLAEVQQRLQRQFDVDVHTLTADLHSIEEVHALADAAESLGPVSLLVNNAGLGQFGSLLDQSEEDIEAVIQVNVTALTLLARRIGAAMAARGAGQILNNASYAAIQPVPSYAVYSGTKAYVLAFSQALHHDLRPHGVTVSAICPGVFRSEFQEKAGQTLSPMARLLLISPQTVARRGIKGVLDGKAVIVPDWRYKALNLAMRALPRTTASWLAEWSMRP